MDDSMHSDQSDDSSFNPFDPAEPPRDEALAALLRQATGDVPAGSVDWDALASRISRALPARATPTWWSYAERWERRMLPLALAASLRRRVGAVDERRAGVRNGRAGRTRRSVVADVAQGADGGGSCAVSSRGRSRRT